MINFCLHLYSFLKISKNEITGSKNIKAIFPLGWLTLCTISPQKKLPSLGHCSSIIILNSCQLVENDFVSRFQFLYNRIYHIAWFCNLYFKLVYSIIFWRFTSINI